MDENDEARTCSICLNTEETPNHPSLLHHTYKTNCNNVTHKDCLYGWIDYAISNRNPTAFKCSKCRRELPVGMLMASANGDFDKVSELFHRYKQQLDLSNADFRELLDSVPQITEATKNRILRYERQAPPSTSHAHQMQVIAALNDNRSELHNVFYAHLQNRYETDAEYRRNKQILTNLIFYYRTDDGRVSRIDNETANTLMGVFAEKTIEYFRNNLTTIQFSATVYLYPYRRIQDTIDGRPYEPFKTIYIEETIDLNTELQYFYDDALRRQGIYEPHRLGPHPFPERINGYDYVSQKIRENGFIAISAAHVLKIIRIHDRIEIIPSTAQDAHPEPPCQDDGTCTIMGGSGIKGMGKRGMGISKRKTGKSKRKTGKQRTKRFYRR